MTAAAVHARDLQHAYARTPVLDGVDFELAPGQLVVVVGPNGSGKTTLVRLLAGVLQPRGGEVTLGGRPLRELSRREVARRLAVVPQELPVPFPYRVRELVAMGRAPHLGPLGRERAEDRVAVGRALRELDLEALAERTFATLSGGEKQRVLLARAYAQHVDTWLLDEPTAHMDLGHRVHTFEWLRRWIAGAPERRAVTLVTHDLVLAGRFGDALVLLDRGRVVARGAAGAVLTPERIADVYELEVRVEAFPGGGVAITPLRSTRATADHRGEG